MHPVTASSTHVRPCTGRSRSMAVPVLTAMMTVMTTVQARVTAMTEGMATAMATVTVTAMATGTMDTGIKHLSRRNFAQ